jgi:NaMN:DMB phosphoribosyltransferase
MGNGEEASGHGRRIKVTLFEKTVQQIQPVGRGWIDAAGRLDLEMRLGEGTGAALAMKLIQAAVAAFTQMATFASAGVSNR